METKANHLMIGGFVLLVLLLAFGFVYWMQNLGAGGSSKRYYILFQGSVSGLGTASNVLFNGLRVGKVTSLGLDPNDGRNVRVDVSIAGDTPIRANSRARIESQGLTGGAAIQLTAGTPDSPLIVPADDDKVAEIKADRATSQSLFEAAPEVMGNANALLVRLNDLVANNEDSIRKTVTNVENFTSMLDSRKEDIDALIKDARELTAQFRRVADKVEKAVDNVSTFVATDGDSFLAQAKQAAESFRQLAEKLDRSIGDSADGIARFAKDGLKEFELFMRDGRQAARTLDRVLERIERNPQSFLFGGSPVPEYNPSQRGTAQ
ncbi:MAG: MlaD family protein [Pseudomonadota bacterium]|nr:MlaD family protein [Pseudomonadota bacterium]